MTHGVIPATRRASAPAEWVNPRDTENFVLKDPLLDWLSAYEGHHGFPHDREGQGYDPRTDFTQFMRGRVAAFSAAVVALLRPRVDVLDLAAKDDWEDRPRGTDTLAAMRRGAAVIWRGFLADEHLKLYGSPALLMRSDVLHGLFPAAIEEKEARQPAPGLGGEWHYRIVDIQFSTLRLTTKGELGNTSSAPAHKAQLMLFNLLLGAAQGYQAPGSYLLGRSWEQRIGGETVRGSSCLDRLALVPQGGRRGGEPVLDSALAAVDWLRRLRRVGGTWKALPEPSVPELRPNMSNKMDTPWRAAKRQIAEALGDLTLLWRVGPDGRAAAADRGIHRWTDAGCDSQAVGVTGDTGRTLQAMLDVNRSASGPGVLPSRVTAAEGEWRPPAPFEFFVDFETVTDVADDLARLPERGGQPLIYMIGCGHYLEGQWRFEVFTAESLTEPAEAKIIDAWLHHMESVRSAVASSAARVFHWSPAETVNLETAYNAAVVRHPEKNWPALPWFDLLNRVVRVEPVVVRGCLGFGLKAVARALNRLGLIAVAWEDGPADGLGAMVGAWSCAEEAKAQGCTLDAVPLMKEIESYNETDCRALYEILTYLRRAH